MRVSLFAWVLSLLVLGVQPVQGSGFKAVKGKVGDTAARWLAKVGRPALALGIGATLLFAPLSYGESADIVSESADIVSERATNSKFDWNAFEAELPDILDRAERKTNLQLKSGIEALNIGTTVNEDGDIVRTKSNPFADILPDHVRGERLRGLGDHLRGLLVLAFLQGADNAGLFKRGTGVSSRVAVLWEQYKLIDTASPEEITPATRTYFTKSWLEAVENEARVALHFLKKTRKRTAASGTSRWARWRR